LRRDGGTETWGESRTCAGKSTFQLEPVS
jgi:hypothetical protein